MKLRYFLGWFIATLWTILFFNMVMGNAKPGTKLSVNFFVALISYLIIGASFIVPFWLLTGG